MIQHTCNRVVAFEFRRFAEAGKGLPYLFCSSIVFSSIFPIQKINKNATPKGSGAVIESPTGWPGFGESIYVHIYITDVKLTMSTALRHGNDTLLLPRAYQLEMLEESLRRNVIIAVSSSPAIYSRLNS